MKNPEISIVVLNWNDRKHTEICLESLANCSKSWQVEIIVVDNGSDDGSPEMVASRFPDVKLIRNKENIGFPRGNNTGIRAAQGKYVFVLNSDIKVLGDCVDALVNYMETHPDVGMVGPRILNRDMTHQSSCRQAPTLWNNFCSASGLARLLPKWKLFSGEHMFYFSGGETRDVDVLVGCFWLVRREAIEEFGLLDEGFFIYAEDVDWCLRCRKAGWRVVFFEGAQAIHYRGVSTMNKDPVRFALTQQQSVLRFWKKYHGAPGRFAMSCLLFGQLLLRWTTSFTTFLIMRKKREEKRSRLRVIMACLRALLSGQSTEGI